MLVMAWTSVWHMAYDSAKYLITLYILSVIG